MKSISALLRLKGLLLFSFVVCLVSADALELKVDPSGPLASPAAALREARELRRAGKVAPDEAVRIVCAPGTYRLTAPLTLGPDDSNVSFSGFGGTVFSGGVELRGFAVGTDGVWRVSARNNRQTYVNAELEIRRSIGSVGILSDYPSMPVQNMLKAKVPSKGVVALKLENLIRPSKDQQ